jgi:hypothetical protein
MSGFLFCAVFMSCLLASVPHCARSEVGYVVPETGAMMASTSLSRCTIASKFPLKLVCMSLFSKPSHSSPLPRPGAS